MSVFRIVLASRPFAEHPVDEVLDVEAGDLGQLRAAEFGQDAQAHRASRSRGGRSACTGRPSGCGSVPSRAPASHVSQTSRSVVADGARIVPRRKRDECLRPPGLRLVEAAEGLADALVLAGAPDMRPGTRACICSARPDRGQLDSRAGAVRRCRGSTSPSGSSCDRSRAPQRRSSQRSSSLRAMRMRRPRRTMRSSWITCSSK